MSQAFDAANERLLRSYDVCNRWASGEPQKGAYEEAAAERSSAHDAFLVVLRSEMATLTAGLHAHAAEALRTAEDQGVAPEELDRLRGCVDRYKSSQESYECPPT